MEVGNFSSQGQSKSSVMGGREMRCWVGGGGGGKS